MRDKPQTNAVDDLYEKCPGTTAGIENASIWISVVADKIEHALRDQVRHWLEQNWSGERKAAFDGKPFSQREFDADFALDLGKTGWIGLGWPKAFGGQARSPLEQIAFMETMERGEAPRIGAAIQANALMMFGTPAQQREYLPEILRGETPDAIRIPPGCRFHPRCPIAIAECRDVDPELRRPAAARTPAQRAACIRV